MLPGLDYLQKRTRQEASAAWTVHGFIVCVLFRFVFFCVICVVSLFVCSIETNGTGRDWEGGGALILCIAVVVWPLILAFLQCYHGARRACIDQEGTAYTKREAP